MGRALGQRFMEIAEILEAMDPQGLGFFAMDITAVLGFGRSEEMMSWRVKVAHADEDSGGWEDYTLYSR